MNNNITRLRIDHPMLTNPARLREAVDRLLNVERVRLDRLWAYYRNPMRLSDCVDSSNADRPYRQAQEWGLPPRITGKIAGRAIFEASDADGIERKEVVIENDIGWRVDTMTDFLFGAGIVLNSTAADVSRQSEIEGLLRRILARNGGLVFLQQLSLLGAVYGSVDVLVKLVPDAADGPSPVCATQLLGEPARAESKSTEAKSTHDTNASPADAPAESADQDEPASAESASSGSDPAGEPSTSSGSHDDVSTATGASHPSPRDLDRLARMVRFEIVEPARALPLLGTRDCTCADAFATVYQVDRCDRPEKPRKSRTLPWFIKRPSDAERITVVELITPHTWQRYEDDELIDEGPSALGRLPLVHIQNMPDPLSYAGANEVEPLIPLQDELNTRLSDRAHRIAMTSFRMYLGKGIDNFTDLPIMPGQMWSTDNVDASIEEFGGDGGCPSEESHIAEIREAMDKISGVSPVAAGAIKGKIGNLTSAAALRVTMMSLLSRTERKRTTYGLAIAQLCELALAWLDVAGLFHTDEQDRGIHIHWSNPIPSNSLEQLEEAKAKQALGIPREVVLRELGYE